MEMTDGWKNKGIGTNNMAVREGASFFGCLFFIRVKERKKRAGRTGH